MIVIVVMVVMMVMMVMIVIGGDDGDDSDGGDDGDDGDGGDGGGDGDTSGRLRKVSQRRWHLIWNLNGEREADNTCHLKKGLLGCRL